jgi:hypothetical protein
MRNVMPIATVAANPAIADHEAWPPPRARREPSAGNGRRRRCGRRASPSRQTPEGERPVMKIRTIPSSRTPRRTRDRSCSAFAAHTKADHAHHTSADASRGRNRAGVRSREEASRPGSRQHEHQVHNSSTGLVRRSSTPRLSLGESVPELGQPPFEEAPLGVRCELERAVVGLACVLDPIEAGAAAPLGSREGSGTGRARGSPPGRGLSRARRPRLSLRPG